MIRFWDKEVYCIEYRDLRRNELLSFFLRGHREEIVCVLDENKYLGIISYALLLQEADLQKSILKEYAVFDETVWDVARKYFKSHKSVFGEIVLLPILNKERQLLCFAYQDRGADKEIRMLHELEEYGEVISFSDIKTEYDGVTIHGCNELAWRMAEYLIKRGIPVNTEGELWKELRSEESYSILGYRNFEIWAEGVHPKNNRLEEEVLRSASVEFECIDEIYEANIKAGKIADAEGDFDSLIEKLREENEIVIIGRDTKAQDAYDLLLAHGVDVCAFQAWDEGISGKKLLGKPVLGLDEVQEKYNRPVFIECNEKNSAWGFGNVDFYSYMGYERNKQYFLLKDYIEIPANNLINVLQANKVVLIGDLYLCNRAYMWCEEKQVDCIGYWDILEENKAEQIKRGMHYVVSNEISEKDICLLIVPQYSGDIRHISDEVRDKKKVYIETLKTYGIGNYTDYFTDICKSISLEVRREKFPTKELRPAGILLGGIPAHSGNILVRGCLDGHPQIMMIREGGVILIMIFILSAFVWQNKEQRVFCLFFGKCTKGSLGE